jgi:hypothetical protein
MKPFILSLLTLLLMKGFTSYSQTNVSGPFFTNTTWGINGSPYNVTGDVQIPAGVSLSIDPGCQINFTGDHEILIKGILIASGLPSKPIVFKGSNSVIPMIIFKSTNLSNSQLSNLEFTGTQPAIQLADESEFNEDPIKNSGVLSVSNATFTNTTVKTKGYQTTAALVLDSVSFISSTVIGIYPRSETITIENSTIESTTIDSDAYNEGITLDNCTVKNSSMLIGCCGGNIAILNSSLTGTSIGDGYGTPVTGPLVITNSELTNSPISLSSATVTLSNSAFNSNSPVGILMGNGAITCIKQTGNGTGTGIEITGLDGYNIGGSVIIENSTFSKNDVAITVSNTNSFSCTHSNFLTNTSYNFVNNSTKGIAAQGNWWGTTSSTTIAASLSDYYDDINHGIIDFSNYLSAPYSSTSCSDLVTAIPSEAETIMESDILEVYPNPATEQVFITVSNYSNTTLELFNVEGQLLQSLSLQASKTALSTGHLKTGIYLVKISSPSGMKLKNLIKN